MELNQFLEVFVEQFDDTDISMLKPTTVLRDLEEWSSLMVLAIIAMADEEYNIRLKGEDIRSVITVMDLFELINSRI